MKIKAVIYEAEDGGYWARVPSLPGVYSQAETLEELEANLREAIELYLSDDNVGSFHIFFGGTDDGFERGLVITM